MTHDDDQYRIRTVAEKVVMILRDRFGHAGEESWSLFDEFHAQYSMSGGWEPADYYDHEGPHAIALEIEFQHQFGQVAGRSEQFLKWRKQHWR